MLFRFIHLATLIVFFSSFLFNAWGAADSAQHGYKRTFSSVDDDRDEDSGQETMDPSPATKKTKIEKSQSDKPGSVCRLHRPKFSSTAVNILMEWLRNHYEYPYPTQEEKRLLAANTNLSEKQVNYWFINARVRKLGKIQSELKNQQDERNQDEQQDEPSIPPQKYGYEGDGIDTLLQAAAFI
ncbi:MAG: homeobox domain-containing protein [Oligoflexia bacterium]|nr:homeobox domain-containing protein [Oligoflexia bacterium]